MNSFVITFKSLFLTLLIFGTSIMTSFAAMVDWENSIITVEGVGGGERSISTEQARQIAIDDAYHQLFLCVQDVIAVGDFTLGQAMEKNETIRSEVNALIKSATIIAEKDYPDGGHSVTMRIPLYGTDNSVSKIVIGYSNLLESLANQSNIQASKSVSNVSNANYSAALVPSGNITGLVIDCRGMGFKPVMTPSIKSVDGKVVYDSSKSDTQMTITNGTVAYSKDIQQISRAGNNPLVVKAAGIDNLTGNPFITVEDAGYILSADKNAGFLKTANIVIVY